MNDVDDDRGNKEKDKQNKVSDTGKNKLDINHKNQVIEWFAEGNKSSEVAKLVKNKYGIKVTRQNMDHYKNTYADEIIQKRSELNHNIRARIPLANKGIRTSKLAEVAGEALKDKDYQEFRLYMKLIANEMGDLENNVIIKGEMNNIINQLLLVIQTEIQDTETLKKIGNKLKNGVDTNE